MDNNSLSHTKWNCKYHIVFITVFKQNKTDSVRKTKSVCCLKFNYSTIDLFFCAVCTTWGSSIRERLSLYALFLFDL